MTEEQLKQHLQRFGKLEHLGGVPCVVRHFVTDDVDPSRASECTTVDVYALVAGTVVFISIAASDEERATYYWNPEHELGANFYVRVAKPHLARADVERALLRIRGWAVEPLPTNEAPREI